MNKSYRIVWNHVRNCLMVVSEATKAKGKSVASKEAVLTTVAAAVMALGTAQIAEAATNWVVGGSSPVGGYVYGNPLSMGAGDTLQVLNTGSISNTATIGAGVSVSSGVTLGTLSGGYSIQNAGSIYGYTRGIYANVATLSGGIANSGQIQTNTATGYAIYLAASSLSGGINNSGSLAAGLVGINVMQSTLSGGITNSGTIQGGTATGGAISVLQSNLSGGINNSGRLAAGRAGIQVALATLSGGITNSGTITVGSNAPSPANGIAVGGSFSGGVFNSGLVTVTGSSTLSAALTVASVSGDFINNTGTMQGGFYGILGSTGLNTLTGGITNSGLLAGTSGVAVTWSGATVAFNNASTGTVLGGIDGAVNVSNSGLLVLETMSGGVTVSGSHVAATISGNYVQNSTGTLQIGVNGVSGSGTVAGNYSTLNVGGVASISGGYIYADLSSNSAITTGGTLSGIITATGGLSVSNLAVRTNITGLTLVWATVGGMLELIDNGSVTPVAPSTISGGTTGPQQVVGGSVTILSTGSVGGGTMGLQIMASTTAGAILNQGTVIGSHTGIWWTPGATLAGGLTNSGLIQGGTIGVAIDGTTGNASSLQNGLNNTGVISGNAIAGVSVVNSTLSGSIHNSGSMTGALYGLYIDPSVVNGGITNSGLMQGSTIAGLLLSASTINGGVQNLAGGTIVGAQYGIAVTAAGQISGGLTNSGLISGGLYAVSVSGNSSLDNIVIAGNNTAAFVGAVYAPNTPVTVAGGATYTLNSNFNVSNFDNQGTLIAPVASVATPTITGNLTLGSSGTFNPTVASASSYTQITVSGTVSLAGALYVSAANVAGTIAPGATLTGIITGNTVTGGFASTGSNSYLYSFTAVETSNQLNLVVSTNTTSGGSYIAAAQSTGNTAALGVAGALQAISTMTGVMTPVTTAFGQMTSAQQISNAMSQTLPGLSGAAPLQSLAVLSAINQAIEARGLNQRGLSSGDTFYGDSSVWMKPFGSWMNQGNSNGAYGFKANSGGLMIGADHQIDTDTKLGAAFAWGNSSATSNAGNTASQSQTSNLYQFIGYGNYAFTDAINLNAQANGGWNNNSSNRQIAFMGTSAQASYSSAVWHAGLGLDSPQHLTESTTVIPQIRYDYTWIRNNGYNETGATNGLGLNVNAQTYQTSIASLDGKLIQKLDDHNSVNANLGVGYNFSPTQTSVAAAFQGAPTLQFTTTGVNPGAVMGHAGVGYVYKVKENIDVGIRYDIDFQSSYTNQIATAKAKWSF